MKDEDFRESTRGKGKKKKSISVINVFVTLLTVVTVGALIAVATLFVYQKNHPYDQTVLGYRPIVVVTGSMEPVIKTGALVIAKQVPFSELEVGDIITFDWNGGQLNTHRIIGFENGGAITKGENADLPDSGSVTAYNFRYKIVYIMNWTAELHTLTGVLKILVWPLGLALLLLIIGGGVKKKRQNAAGTEQPGRRT